MQRESYVSVDCDHDDGPPLAIFDIKSRWQLVTFHVFLGMCCSVPGLGLVSALFLFREYRLIKGHQSESSSNVTINYLYDAMFWSVLFMQSLVNGMIVYQQYDFWRNGTVDLQAIGKHAQINMLTSAIYTGSGIGRIILECQTAEMAMAVSRHLQDEFQDMRRHNPTAASLLDRLQKCFPLVFKTNQHGDRDRAGPAEMSCLDQGVLMISSLVMVVGIVWMEIQDGVTYFSKTHAAHDDHDVKWLDLGPWTFCVPTSVFFWLTLAMVVCQVTLNWQKLMKKILFSASVKMADNTKQLLLFTGLTAPPDKWNSIWSAEHMAFFQQELDINGDLFESKEVQVRKALEKQLAEGDGSCDLKGFCLDLKVKEDADAWWRLRQYVQVDFLNETVAMEFIGVIVMMLLLCFSFVAFVNWLVNNRKWSVGLSLLSVLSVCLLITMYKVFDACVAINNLWENDQQVLSRASLEALMDDDDQAAKAVAILQAMLKKVEVFDNRQELFGVIVTKNLRNGWMLTIVGLLISSAWEISKPLIEKASIDQIEADLQKLALTPIGQLLHLSQHETAN